MSEIPKNPPDAPRTKSAMKVVARGHINGNDVTAAAELHQKIIEIMTGLAAMNREINEAAVLRVFVGKFTESRLFESDLMLPLLLVALSAAGSTCEPLARIAADNKKSERTPGVFSNLLKTHVALLSPVLFDLYQRTKDGLKPTDEMTHSHGGPVTKPLQAFNRQAMEVLSGDSTPRISMPAPPIETDDNTGHHDMSASIEVRPTNTIADILHIFTHAPQHQEAHLIELQLQRTTLNTDEALALVMTLNDSSQINLYEVTKNPAWNFLWDVRKMLWERKDLKTHLFPKGL